MQASTPRASVACGNIALQYIYVSFAQMVTAAGPLFTIMLMYTMTGKRYSKEAYASMIPMCGRLAGADGR